MKKFAMMAVAAAVISAFAVPAIEGAHATDDVAHPARVETTTPAPVAAPADAAPTRTVRVVYGSAVMFPDRPAPAKAR